MGFWDNRVLPACVQAHHPSFSMCAHCHKFKCQKHAFECSCILVTTTLWYVEHILPIEAQIEIALFLAASPEQMALLWELQATQERECVE
jgi:hypothetical protein